jgi:NAD-dependent deacetylase
VNDRVRQWVVESQHIVVLTGAGMSAESGVPTFRDAQTGVWAQFDPQDLATESAFRAHPQRVWDWYAMRREMIRQVTPNAGHRALARYAQSHPGRLSLVTQNVDGLHQMAGQLDAITLHGNIAEDQWLDTPKVCCQPGRLLAGSPPRCPTCGNLRRPAVVWFGENLPPHALHAAEQAVQGCDLMLVVGTSGVVYPAAGLALSAHQMGARLVVVNPEATELDRFAALCLRETAAQCLPRLFEHVEGFP